MMKKKALIVAGILAALAIPQVAGAEGFGLIEYSAEGVAMGGARMFADDDPANIAYNPASITKIKGKAFKTGVTYISPHGQSRVKMKDQLDTAEFKKAATAKAMSPEVLSSAKTTAMSEAMSGKIPATTEAITNRVTEIATQQGVGYAISSKAGLIPGGNYVNGKNIVHPGYAPHMYYVQQMTDKDWWGIGEFSRYSMVSEFSKHSPIASNAYLSKLTGVSITPTYAHKFDNKWSAAVGAEINYVSLEMHKNVYANAYSQTGVDAMAGGYPSQTKGHSYALGWNGAVNYSFDDKNEFGVVYRSKIKHSMEATFDMNTGASVVHANAYGKVILPDQWSIGYSHKFDKRSRIEVNAMRTNWNTYDALNIFFDREVSSGVSASLNPKNYKYGWRYAIGYEYKFSPKYTGMLGFSFDDDSIPYDGGDFIVPTGLRRTYSCGLRYNDKKQSIAVGFAWMQLGDLSFKGRAGDLYSKAYTHNNSTKIMSVSYEYHF